MTDDSFREYVGVGLLLLGPTLIALAILVWVSANVDEWVSMTITFLAERWELFLNYPSGTIQVLLWTGIFLLMVTWLVVVDPYE